MCSMCDSALLDTVLSRVQDAQNNRSMQIIESLLNYMYKLEF